MKNTHWVVVVSGNEWWFVIRLSAEMRAVRTKFCVKAVIILKVSVERKMSL